MKKLLIVFSLFISLLINDTNISASRALENEVSRDCGDSSNEIVAISNSYGAFIGNGFVYKVDGDRAYIVSSNNINLSDKRNKIIYRNGVSEDITLIIRDSYNGIVVMEAKKNDSVKGICLANSYYSMPGQLLLVKGYSGFNNTYIENAYFMKKGVIYYSKDYVTIYKDIIQLKYESYKEGMVVIDELGNLIGMICGNDSKLSNSSFVTETNKLTKIVDSIVKTGNYKTNYIKYNLVDYSRLDESSLNNYKVNKNVNYGVVITTFKPFNYLFGGLNQGMVIQSVNSIKVENMYELDNQLFRYKKDDTICLGVVKKNGKTAYYYVKV